MILLVTAAIKDHHVVTAGGTTMRVPFLIAKTQKNTTHC